METTQPQKSQNNKAAVGCVGTIIVLMLIIMMVIGFSDSKTEKDPNKPDKYTVWNNVRALVKSNLNNPETYESDTWGDITPVSDTEFVLYHIYTAKNAFGVPTKFNQLFYVDKEGNINKVVNQDPNNLK